MSSEGQGPPGPPPEIPPGECVHLAHKDFLRKVSDVLPDGDPIARAVYEKQRGILEDACVAAYKTLVASHARRLLRAGIEVPGVSRAHVDFLMALANTGATVSEGSRGPLAKYPPARHWFATLNPRPEVDPDDVLKTLCRSLPRAKWIGAYEFVIEQRSTDSANPHGWHFHLCIETVSEILHRDVISKLAQICKAYMPRASVDVRPLEPRHKDYVRGHKKDAKLDAVRVNHCLRDQRGYEQIYGNFAWDKFSPVGHGFSTSEEQASEEQAS